MHQFCIDSRLELYDDTQFLTRPLAITAAALSGRLLPILVRASESFARERAWAAKRRAVKNFAKFGLTAPHQLGAAEFITELMFDRQFRSSPRETCSRRDLCRKVAHRIAAGAAIEMAIAALPYKFSCPLKTRGQSPDLGEVNFMLGLYEIAAAVEVLYREVRPKRSGPLAKFTIVSDGSRFNELTNEPDAVVEAYRRGLATWIRDLRLDGYIELLDYQALLRERLSEAARDAKEAIRKRALEQYAAALRMVFEPCNMAETLMAAARNDPDPEQDNAEGRFVSLLKSLAFTVKYRCLDAFRSLPGAQFRALYRDLVGHIFEPFVVLSPAELRRAAVRAEAPGAFPPSLAVKEYLRQAMLGEAWSATIAYIAEIKSDREQPSEPISSCLPNHLRWTIHAKPGQLGLLTPSALGKPVLAWAGAAVFKRAKREGIRLCTLPVLALEGVGAVPVFSGGCSRAPTPHDQPLFYIYPDVAFEGLDTFLTDLPNRLVRKRAT
jgi:hypothetical protein